MGKIKSEDLVDKGIDVLVVIFGILIALSIDSYRETKRSERQWNIFANHFKVDANNLKKNYSEIAVFYSKRFETAKSLLKQIQSEGVEGAEGLDKFLSKMAQIKAEFQKDTMFEALVQSGNEFLIDDVDRLQSLGLLYSFETLAMSNVKSLSEHFIPDYQRVLKMYYAKDKGDKKLKADLIFLFHNYIAHMEHNKATYEKQIKVAEDALKHLNR